MRRPLSTVAGASLLLLLSAVPLAAQETEVPSPLDIVLASLSGSPDGEYMARFATEPVPGFGRFPDPANDHEHASGEEPGFTPPHVDILDAWAVTFDAGPLRDDLLGPTAESDVWSPTGTKVLEPPGHAPLHTFSGAQPFNGTQHGAGSLLFGFELAGTPDLPVPGRCEYVVWVSDASRGPTFSNLPSFPRDPAGGTNVAFGLRIEPEGQGLSSTFTLDLEKGIGFVEQPTTDVRSFITPEFVGLLVPANQIGEMSAVNFYSFCMESGFTFEAAETGADQTELTETGQGDLGLLVVEQSQAATTTTLLEPTTTAPEPASTLATTASEPAEDGFPWLLALVAGVVGLGVAGWLLVRDRDGCRDLRKRYEAAKRECEETRQATDEAIDALENIDADLEDLEQERRELCREWPPACWSTEEGSWVEDSQGNRITSLDVHLRKIALGDVWEDYKAGKLTARELEAKWQEMDTPEFRAEMEANDQGFKSLLADVDADIAKLKNRFDETFERAQQLQKKAELACALADESKEAYERCAAAAAAHDAADPESQTADSDPGGEEPQRRVRVTGPAQDPIRVNLDFSVVAMADEVTRLSGDGAAQFVVSLERLPASTGAGTSWTAQGSGLHIEATAEGFPAGSYVVTSEGVIPGGIDQAARTDVVAEAAASATSPQHGDSDDVAGLIEGEVDEWLSTHQVLEVRRSLVYQLISATPAVVEELSGIDWVCVEKVWEVAVSKPMKHTGPGRRWDTNSPLLRQRCASEISRMSGNAVARIERDAQSLAEWRVNHEARPCS